MKFIHCADLHLDSKMESSFPAKLARKRRAELIQTFQRLIAYAEDNGADAVIIAGDFFDSGLTRAVREVLARMGKSRVRFYCLSGNHDEGLAFGDLPSNVYTFSEDWTYYEEGNVTIAGAARFDEGSAQRLALAADRVNLVALHGELTQGRSGEYRINLASLAGKNIDYLALGHYHSYQTGRIDSRGIYAYSGCPEGRGFDECGEKGFVLLETDQGVKATFVPFASSLLHDVKVSLDESVTTLEGVEDRVEEAVWGMEEGDFVRLDFIGDRNSALVLHTDYFSETYLAERFRFVKAVDHTRLAIDADDFRGDVSLKGEFVRLVRGSDLPRDRQDRILECGIRALLGEDVI
ncbi:MAG: exonuclease SbcCD subunit D [Christensenellaceae bacterium]